MQGLNDLYDFKLKYPEADLEPFLKKSSHFFQNYIERGLKNIGLERGDKSKNPGESASSAGRKAPTTRLRSPSMTSSVIFI